MTIFKNSILESPNHRPGEKTIRCIYELIAQGVNGSLKKESIVSTIGEVMSQSMDLPSIVLDVLNILDSETSCSEISDERHNFCGLVKECEKIIPEKLLKERLEIETLQDIGTLKNRNFYTKFIRIKTKL